MLLLLLQPTTDQAHHYQYYYGYHMIFNSIMGMIDLETINRLWKVSCHHRLSANKYLINGSSLTITSFHPASHNYQRMLTLLLIPKSLKHFRIINPLNLAMRSQVIGIIGSVISRNSCALTSIDLI
jgi:hypothetical protein